MSGLFQAAEGLHCHPRAAGGDHGGLLADAVGEQLHHRGDVDEASRDGAGECCEETPGGQLAAQGLTEAVRSPRQEKCHQYWPAERSARYQYFVVDPMAEYNMPQYILREFKVTDARVSAAPRAAARQGWGWAGGFAPTWWGQAWQPVRMGGGWFVAQERLRCELILWCCRWGRRGEL